MVINPEESRKISEIKEIEALKAQLLQKERTQKIVIKTIAGTTLAIFLFMWATSTLNNKKNENENGNNQEFYSNSASMANESSSISVDMSHLRKDMSIDFESFEEFPNIYKYGEKAESKYGLTASISVKRDEYTEDTAYYGENFSFLLYKDDNENNKVVFIDMKEYLADKTNCHEYISGTTFDCTTLLNPNTGKYDNVTLIPFLSVMPFLQARGAEVDGYHIIYTLSIDNIYSTIDIYFEKIGSNEFILREVPNYVFQLTK